MHELSLATSMVETAQQVAKENNASRVLNITIAVGVLSGVEKEALNFCFAEVTQGTILEKAELFIEEIPISIKCDDCSEVSDPNMDTMCCQKCGSNKVRVVSGRELQIINLEVE